jgi:anti-sigma B factor antagonist
MDLRIDLDSEPSRQLLRLSGALDLQSKTALLDAGRSAIVAGSGGAIVLDLSEVTFIDSSGVGILVALSGDAEDAGVDFLLRDPSRRVWRILEVTGLSDRWRVEHSSTA